MENFSEQTSELQSKTASQSHSAAAPAPASLPLAIPVPIMSVEEETLEFHSTWGLNNSVCAPLANHRQASVDSPILLPYSATFLQSALRREANEKMIV